MKQLGITTLLLCFGLIFFACTNNRQPRYNNGYDDGYQGSPPPPDNRPPPPEYGGYPAQHNERRPMTEREKIQLFYKSCQIAYNYYQTCLPSFTAKYSRKTFSLNCTKLLLKGNRKWAGWHLCVIKSKGYCSTVKSCFGTGGGQRNPEGFGSSTF